MPGPAVAKVEAAAQTEMTGGAPSLIAAAREEIVRLRSLNQRLLEAQKSSAHPAGSMCIRILKDCLQLCISCEL